MRMKEWAKNLFVFLPLFFSGKLFFVNLLPQQIMVFVAFSFMASAVYIINDIFDIASDKKHPIKKYRSLAAGNIKKETAIVFALLCIAFSLYCTIFVGNSFYLLICLASYLLINIGYSFRLKNIAFVDVACIATGFLLRVMAGGFVSNIKISGWLYTMVFLLAIFLALAKRRDDVLLNIKNNIVARKVITQYKLKTINALLYILSVVIIVVYALYCMAADTILRLHSNKIICTAVFVLLGMCRYLYIVFKKNKAGSPTDVLYSDNFMQLLLLLWLFSFYATIYC
jgi:decaprenyl-phosphate phosphoribosyltransferase